MPESIRYHLDESVDPDIAEALRNQGIDVTTSQEEGLLGADDLEQFSFAKSESRTIVTHDGDFLRIASMDFNHFGVAYCSFEKYSIGVLILHCMTLHNQYTMEEMKGRVEFM